MAYFLQASALFLHIERHILANFGQFVLHPTKEGQFPRDPIFLGLTPIPQKGPWSGDSETVGGIEKNV